MPQAITVKTKYGEHVEYTMLRTVEDMEEFQKTSILFCEEDNLKKLITEGEIILVNHNGGWCTFKEDYHAIID